MTIGVHAVAAFRKNPTGVEGYLRNLLSSWEKDPDAASHRFLLYVNNKGAEGRWQMANSTLRTLSAPALWTQARLSWEMLKRPPDTLFVPATALPRVLPKRCVATIHGLEFYHAPRTYGMFQRRYLRWATADAATRASHLIAVSEATKRDLVGFLNVHPERISVIHHGLSPQLKMHDQKPGTDFIGAPYYLYMGRLETKKNVDGIIRAYTILRTRRSDLLKRLVLAGSFGVGFSVIEQERERSPFRDEIVLTGYVSEEDKWRLISEAHAFVFPSWAEGFGFPILEAQQAGIPVVTGDNTAMPEVAGFGGALFVPPGDTEAIANAMEQIVIDEALRKDLSAAGSLNIERFSWENTAKRTLEVLVGSSI